MAAGRIVAVVRRVVARLPGEQAKQDPSVQRRRLRLALREARRTARLSQKDVAQALDWSPSKLIRIENGAVGISTTDLKALLDHYGIKDRRWIDQLVEMARGGRTLSWNHYRDLLNKNFITLLGLESSASIIRQYEPVLVPGLLQTEEYGREVLRKVSQATEEQADRLWELREARQQLHDREDPPEMFFILDEAVVRRQVGDPPIMRRQLERLRQFVDRPQVSVLIISFGSGAHAGMSGPFVILESSEAADPDLIFLEDGRGDCLLRDEQDETSRYLSVFWDLEEKALSRDETRVLLDGLIAG